MNIKAARHGDLQDMLEMLSEYQESLETIRVINKEQNEEFLKLILGDDNRGTIFIGRTSTGHPAAFAIVCRRLSAMDAEWLPNLVDLYVRPGYRLKGFGRQIFEYVVRWAKTQKYPRLCWQVENLNLAGQYMFDQYNPELAGWVSYSLDLSKT